MKKSMNGNRDMNASCKKINKTLYYQIIGLFVELHGHLSACPPFGCHLCYRERQLLGGGKKALLWSCQH